MNPSDDKTHGPEGTAPGPAESDQRGTGLPGLRTWPAVYVFVLAVFALWVGLLIALSKVFS